MDIIEIKNIPHSPGTSWDITEVFNPLSEPFIWSMDGKPYTIPKNDSKGFPEFIARHLAKHLARKIVYGNAYREIEEKAKGQLTPDNAKAIPNKRVEIMEAWLLQPSGQSPEEGVKSDKVVLEKTADGVVESPEMKLKEKLARMKRQKKALKVRLSNQKVEKEEKQEETN